MFPSFQNTMAGTGAGYDLSVTTYSPDGRVYQIEYSEKAVESSGTALALCCKNGVILATEKTLVSKMLVPGSTRRVFPVESGISMGFAGMVPDAKELVELARKEAREFKDVYDEEMPPKLLAERVAMYMHAHTQYWSVRPFGVSVFLGSWKGGKSELFCIAPSGAVTKMSGEAIGKGRQAAKNEIEKVDFSNLTVAECLSLVTKAIIKAHDDNDKEYEIEIAVISDETRGVHQEVSREVLSQLVEQAKQAIRTEQE
jgi:20S proteasome subunit alpha 7